MMPIFKRAKESVTGMVAKLGRWLIPLPEHLLECSFNVQGSYDGAGCKRNLLMESARSKTAFDSQISCEADIRVSFFPATDKRIDVGINRLTRKAFNVDHLKHVMEEFTEQDIFDVWKLFQTVQRDPNDLLTSRAEIIVNLGFLGHVGPMNDFVKAFSNEEDEEMMDTSYEGIEFEEFLHVFYTLVVVEDAKTALGKTFANIMHEIKIRRHMSPLQRIMARMS